MQDEIFMPLHPSTPAGSDRADLRRLHDVPVELAVEIGRTKMTIGQTLELRPGSVVSLNRLAGEPVDLLVNGKPIARGEVVVIDEEFGLRVTDVVSGRQMEEEAAEAAEAAMPAFAPDEGPAHPFQTPPDAAMQDVPPHPFETPPAPADDPSAASVDDITMGDLSLDGDGS
jgi:flagellar motor switch protein FliN/FliY